jgi:hypothetical protein
LGRGGGELANVYRTGGIDHDNGTEPGRARWFTPQLWVAAGAVKVAGATVAGAGPVPGPGPIQRNGAVYLDEPAGKACALAGAHGRTQVLSSTAPWRVRAVLSRPGRRPCRGAGGRLLFLAGPGPPRGLR